jgi:hypothetical protein
MEHGKRYGKRHAIAEFTVESDSASVKSDAVLDDRKGLASAAREIHLPPRL